VLNIAATHHVARFRLQAALKQIAEHYPDVQLSVRQSTPEQMAELVRNGEVLSTAHNRCVADCDIGSHAELRALAEAGRQTGSYRLDGCDVYITLEPCAMCASAIIQARIRRVIYGAAEPKTGAAGSVVNLFANPLLNKHTAIKGGILEDECKAVLQAFFQTRRKQG